MAEITVRFPIKVDGVFTSVTSVHLLSEDTTYGVKETVSGTVKVANGTAMVEEATGKYVYTFTGSDAVTAYTQSVKWVYGGTTTYSVGQFSGPTNLLVGELSITPLYNTQAVLLKKIRMQTAVDVQVYAMIDSAISTVRLGFFDALTATRALLIAGYSDSVAPTTDEEVLKSRAALCEVFWVMYILVQSLPQLFIDTSHEVRNSYNEEPFTRDASTLQAFRDELWNNVQGLLNGLKEPTETGDGSFSVGVIGKQDSDGDVDVYSVSQNFIGQWWGYLDDESTNV